MKAARQLLIILGLAASAAALAQYQWIDRDGRRVFSDTPPPPELPQENLLSAPRAPQPQRAAPAAAASAASAPAAPMEAASAPPRPPAGTTRDAGQAPPAQQRAEAIRADNCRRALGAKAALDSGQRMARIDERGEREFIDDAQRAEEQQRLMEIIGAECD